MKKEKNCNLSCEKKTSIGGQALMEGIMMRGPETTAMAVRNTAGEIVVESFPTESKKRSKFFKLPIIRGVFNYIDSMILGTKCLMRSAEISGLEEAEEELKRDRAAKKAAKAAKQTKNTDIDKINSTSAENSIEATGDNGTIEENDQKIKKPENIDQKSSSALMTGVMIFSVLLGIIFAVAIFIILPAYLYKGAAYLMPFLKPENTALASLVKSVFEGVLKIILLVGYMAAISLMKDIKRTFMFHGAEHKAIFCYEQGLPLTIENIKIQKRFHPRCGTSFLILMLIVGIFISFLIDPLFILIFKFETPTIVRVLIKLLLLPIIVGIGYELIKLAGRHDNIFTRIISAPGVWLQHITTKEPDDAMIECAIIALEKVIPENNSDNW